MDILEKENKLKRVIGKCESVLVAFSGGVDSSLVASVAEEVLNEKAVAVTARSHTYPSWDAKDAKKVGKEIGIRHIFIETEEFDNENFVSNPPDRCYYCKTELLENIDKIRREINFKRILDGTNKDDLKDYRPGLRAIEEFGEVVKSPLSEVELTKAETRKLAKKRGLSVSEKPSSPCLASRIPYGTTIRKEKVKRIEEAEKYLHSLSFKTVRVRDHKGIARIEVDEKKIPKLVDLKDKITKHLKNLDYDYVSLDLEGYRTGSLNPKN